MEGSIKSQRIARPASTSRFKRSMGAAMARASGPARRTTPMPPRPGGVAMATMVSSRFIGKKWPVDLGQGHCSELGRLPGYCMVTAKVLHPPPGTWTPEAGARALASGRGGAGERVPEPTGSRLRCVEPANGVRGAKEARGRELGAGRQRRTNTRAWHQICRSLMLMPRFASALAFTPGKQGGRRPWYAATLCAVNKFHKMRVPSGA